RRLTGGDERRLPGIDVDAPDVVTAAGKAGGRHASHVSESEDANAHVSPSLPTGAARAFSRPAPMSSVRPRAPAPRARAHGGGRRAGGGRRPRRRTPRA